MHFPKARHYSTTSVLLSRVLDDIGLNTSTIDRRQRTYLKLEKLSSECYRCNDQSLSVYHFGSQIEGSTVDGLASDIDSLFNDESSVVIQHSSEWVSGKRNLLIVKDSNIPGAYCRLQLYRDDVALPADELPDHIQYEYDYHGRVLLRNSSVFQDSPLDGVIHGPALTDMNVPGRIDSDSVFAYKCLSWPDGGYAWLERVSHSNKAWPPTDVVQFVRNSGFFLVPVGYRVSAMNEVEWRISPSLAERRLMLSMNVIQMKCYVLLKMIKKQFITQDFGEILSSYVMKTALFYLMEKTSPIFWREDNLVVCVQQCLFLVFLWLSLRHCPNYIFPDENLFAGKHCTRSNDPVIVINSMIQSEGRYLLNIDCDFVGRRLYEKLSARLLHTTIPLSDMTRSVLVRCEYSLTHLFVRSFNKIIFYRLDMNIQTFIDELCDMIKQIIQHAETECAMVEDTLKTCLLHFTALLGSAMASSKLSKGDCIPDNVMDLMSICFPADCMSVKLKLASILYCSNRYIEAKTLLESIEPNYDFTCVQPICSCNDDLKVLVFKGNFIKRVSVCTGPDEVRQYMACCVMFTPQELYICPPELRIEMSRQDGASEINQSDRWMKCAVVDSCVLLFYLEYITYKQLGDDSNKHNALDKLEECIEREDQFLYHKDTAFNVLGQCLEHEGRHDEAIYFFSKSYELKPENNVAGWHSTMWHINNLKRGKPFEHLFTSI